MIDHTDHSALLPNSNIDSVNRLSSDDDDVNFEAEEWRFARPAFKIFTEHSCVVQTCDTSVVFRRVTEL